VAQATPLDKKGQATFLRSQRLRHTKTHEKGVSGGEDQLCVVDARQTLQQENSCIRREKIVRVLAK